MRRERTGRFGYVCPSANGDARDGRKLNLGADLGAARSRRRAVGNKIASSAPSRDMDEQPATGATPAMSRTEGRRGPYFAGSWPDGNCHGGGKRVADPAAWGRVGGDGPSHAGLRPAGLGQVKSPTLSDPCALGSHPPDEVVTFRRAAEVATSR